MPTHYTGRVTLIVSVAIVFLAAIFSPLIQHPSWTFDRSIPFLRKTNILPGIDMVGGTSLLYEIRTPADRPTRVADLDVQMMNALKRRVDPEGVRNLIWRPQGGNRLEIQMPLSGKGDTGDVDRKRNDLLAARAVLEANNVSRADVVAAVESQGGPDRAKLQQLSGGSKARLDLFDQLADAYQAVGKAHVAKDAAAEAAAQIRYDELKGKIEELNVTAEQLESVLPKPIPTGATPDPKVVSENKLRQAQYEALKAKLAGFPKQLDAVENYRRAYDTFNTVRAQIDDVGELKRLLKGAGVLEFHILAVPPSMNRGGDEKSNIPDAEFSQWVERLNKQGARPRSGDRLRWFLIDNPDEFKGDVKFPCNGQQYVLAWITPEKSLDNREGRARWRLERAGVGKGEFGENVVSFSFDPQGGQYFGELTGNNTHERLAIVLDNRVISAPGIRTKINGSGQIDGGPSGFSTDQLNYLVKTLGAGSLPAELSEEPLREQTVGPQLGQDNLRRGLLTCAFGLVVVAVFLISYYHLAGVVATFAVFLNMVLILGAMAMLKATFTLPGVAGIVLTIGTAVDANVLIFERLREEQLRGLSLRMALRNAYERAWSAILDSNVTTAITALVLYWLGSEEVKGFGLTLLIGILSSLFTALFVTRTIFAVMVDRFGLQKLGSLPLTFPKWDRMLKPNIDWMGKAWAFYSFSAVFLTIGLVAFGVKLAKGQMLDIEFSKGTSVEFDLKSPMEIGQVRKRVEAVANQRPQDLPSPQVVAIGRENRSYEIVTPNDNAKAVRQAVLDALGDNLKVQLPSSFAGVDQTVEAAMDNKAVVPIADADDKLPGLGNFSPQELSRHVGGVAVILRDLTPPLTAEQVEDRIQQARLSTTGDRNAAANLRLNVVQAPFSETGGKPVVVVLASSGEFTYDARDEQKRSQWLDSVAAPIWRVVNESVNKPAGLQKVTNFDAQVASETTRDAIAALTISVLAIMAYIWVRFGNLKYGTATVVALLHDTLFTLAAIGVAHYIANTFIGRALLIEPFRINLTLVAGVLTIMGYSMIDTIVVFDRVREIRGKYGHISRQVINDAINQTLSRTLLTAGTTIVTVGIMYFLGGTGIHGFTFALLIGILVGTYSSVAIAAPLLLVGADRPQEANAARGRRPVGQLQRA